MKYKLSDFKKDMRKSTIAPEHFWVNSLTSTCTPIRDCVCGIGSIYSPPLSLGDFSMRFHFKINGHTVVDDGNKGKNDCGLLFANALWYPHQIERFGTYHYLVDEKILSVYVKSTLIPLYKVKGVMLKIEVTNRSKEEALLEVKPYINPGNPKNQPLENWDYCRPWHVEKDPCEKISDNEYENSQVRITLYNNKNTDVIKQNETGVFYFTVCMSEKGTKALDFDPLWETLTEKAWENKLNRFNESYPVLTSDNKELEDYYKTSVISGLVALWESDEFKFENFPVTSGIDGGAVCLYQWSMGYNAEFIILNLKDKVFDLLKLLINSGIDKHICMSVNGVGQGNFSYSYNLWSIIYFYYKTLCILQKGFEYYEDIKKFFITEDARLNKFEHLTDYGTQNNMLEMRSLGYEHYVPSPNAERVWCYEVMAEISDLTQNHDGDAWRAEADKIRKSLVSNLWNDKTGWFDCLFPNGHRETVYTIQMFDVIRFGGFADEINKKVISHINDDEFLSDYGVNSVSKTDLIHYETNDPDWSGGGAYTGDCADLCRTLWELNEPDLADDVLSRLLWMGKMLPYYPQEHYCDRPMVPAHKRANDIAGVCPSEAILFGLLGLDYTLKGKIIINPKQSKFSFNIYGIKFKEKTIDIIFKNGIKVYINGTILYEGELKKIVIE